MIPTLRLAEPWEAYPLACGARRVPGGTVTCEKPALHREGCALAPGHSCGGRGKRGQWFFWFSPCASC